MEVEINGQEHELSTRFRDSGKNLILFVHGLGCSRETYDGAWEQNTLGDYSLLSFDLVGFGRSPKPESFAYDLKSHAEVLEQILHQHADKNIYLVANSWGPAIAMQLPSETLNGLSHFVNIEGRLMLDDLGNSRKVAETPFEEFKDSKYPVMLDKYKDHQTTAYRLNQTTSEVYYAGASSLVDSVQKEDLVSKFRSLSCRKSYMFGEENRGLKLTQELADIPSVEVANSGHFMMIENPNDFYSNLGKLINS